MQIAEVKEIFSYSSDVCMACMLRFKIFQFEACLAKVLMKSSRHIESWRTIWYTNMQEFADWQASTGKPIRNRRA